MKTSVRNLNRTKWKKNGCGALFIVLVLMFCLTKSSYAQQITYSGNNVPLKEVFDNIKKQTGYVTAYSNNLLENAKPVTIKAVRMPLNDFLTVLLKDQLISFSVVSRTIVLTAKRPAGETSKNDEPPARSHQDIVTGMIQDDKGKPLTNATIRVKGSGVFSSSDARGVFSVPANAGDVLLFTYVGFAPQEIKVKGSGLFVSMKPSNSVLDEVQVIAYGTTTKRFNTGNVATIKAEEIVRQPVTNVIDALSGLVPGLQITQQNGLPGSNYKIELRGQNSLLNAGNPLYIVDGVPFNSTSYNQVGGSAMSALGKLQVSGYSSEAGVMGLSPLNSISPADIESIEVLKDADATAIYGSRAANGVILITTKKGKSGATRVNVNLYEGNTFLSKVPEYLSSEQYLAGRRELLRNDGVLTPGTTDFDLNGTWDINSYHDLVGEMIKKSSTRTAYISISGGSDQTQYMISANYGKVSPPYDGDFSDQKLSGSFNVNSSAFDSKLKFGLSGTYSMDNNTLPGMSTFTNLNLPPMYPAFHKPDGSLNWWGTTASNPYANLLKNYNAKTNMFSANLSLGYSILPDLNLTTRFGYTTSDFKENRVNPLLSMNPLLANNISSSLWGNNSNNSWIFEPSIDYRLNTDFGNFSVMAGATVQQNLSEAETTVGYNFLTDAALYNINAAAQTLLTNTSTKYRYAAIFGRLNYQLNGKYILNLTARRDGSSRFAPAKRMANFGAIGAGWIFSEEKFVKKHLPFLSYGKLRGSYGLTGNDGIGDYRYLNTYTINSNKYYNQPSLFPTRLFSTNYSWESNKKLEGGIELGFLKDRILITASRFRNRSSNQLVDMTLAPTAGINKVQANMAALIQNVGWEFELKTKNINKGKFSWTTNMNLTKTSNKLLDFPGLKNSPYANTFVIGQPLSIMKLYQSAGVDPLTGLYLFNKADGSQASWGLTQADLLVQRNTNPDYYGMITNNISYGNWQIYFTFRFVKQTGKNVLFSSSSSPFSTLVNLPTFFLEQSHWQKPGDVSQMQKYSNVGFTSGAYSSAGLSDMAYTDASFMRLKNVGISYSLRKEWLKRVHINDMNIYCNAQNLFTLTSYYGFDPETQGTNLPPMGTIVWGVQFNL